MAKSNVIVLMKNCFLVTISDPRQYRITETKDLPHIAVFFLTCKEGHTFIMWVFTVS